MSRALSRRLTFVIILTMLALCAPVVTATSATVQDADPVTLSPRGDSGLTGAMLGDGPANQPSIVFEAPTENGIIMGMAIRGNLLYFATKDPGNVTAIDRANGNVVWTVDLGAESTVFGPEPAGDLIVLGVWGSDANAVVALDAATGAERWRVATTNLPTAPTHVDGTIYVAAEGGLDAESGLYALDAATGAERWVFSAPEALDLGERVAVSDGIVVASAWSLEDNGIGAYAIDAATGQVLWTFQEADELTADPIVGNGVVLLSDLPRTWALDLRSGTTLWEHTGASTGGGQALDATAAYFGYGGEVQAVSIADGSPLWSAPVSGVAGPPVIAGGLVYSAVWKPSDDPTNHWLHAFDAVTGTEVWSLELEHKVSGNQPLADSGALYVDTNSSVVAFASGTTGTSTTPPVDTPATEVATESGEYTSAEFGHTITWSPPWRISEAQSSAEPGQDFVTLLSGDASLALRASSEVSSPEDMVTFYASSMQSRQDAEVTMSVDGPDFARAVARYTVDGTSYIEYVEVRSLPQGGIFLSILTAPADWFPLAHQAAQQLVSVDQQPPFRAAPGISGG